MTKSQNTKNEQLTEQWKKGELPYAEYYIKLAGGEYTNDVWDVGGWQSFNKKGDVVVEVLAPVPSYEEWKGKDEALTALLAEYGKLTKELQDEKEKNMTRFSLRSPADEVIIEKQVWASTLHRSMMLEAENAQLKELLRECLAHLTIGRYGTSVTPINILCDEVEEALK